MAKSVKRNRLIEEYSGYAKAVALRLVQQLGLPSDVMDDCVSSAYEGLIDAAARFDFKSKSSFKSYAYIRIRGSIIDNLRGSSELKGKVYHYAKAFQAANNMRETSQEEEFENGRSSSGLELSKIIDFAANAALAFRMSYEDSQEELEAVTAESPLPEDALLKKETVGELRQFISQLDEKQQEVLKTYYFEGKTFQEIGELMGVKKAWVCKLHTRAVNSLREVYLKNVDT